MNSEKVKEIKKGLEVCNGLCGEDCPYHSVGCMNDLSKDALTLINELESENERLSDDIKFQQMTDKTYKYNMACENGKQFKQINELKEENKELKDRIAELENGIAKSMLGCEFLPECTNEKLKQFATLLKVKTVLTPSGWCVNIEDIEKTLKEFIEK